MVERGHSIPLDAEKSLVARAARTKEMVLVDDVRADPEFLPNPLLPDTKSEVAVPMVVGDQVLGVFDVQHDEAAYFTESYLDVFSTLAGQIATAFQNAQLFAERKRAEEGLKRERRLFVGGPVVVFRWVNAEGWPVEYASPNMASFIGYTAEDLMNGVVPYANLVYPDDLMHVAEEVAGYTEEGQTSFEQEYRMVKANGDVIWIYDFTTIIRNERGEVTHYDGYIMDITERKRAEESMAQEKYFADTVINSLPGIFFMHDTQGKLVRCNKAYQELFGFSDEEMENVYAVDRFPEDERESILSVMGKIFTEPEQQSVEGHLLTKEGKTPFNLMAQRLITGGEVYLLGTGTDITERKQAEAERQRFTTQLGTAAEVATRANAILDPDELLNAVVALVKERFDLYHAHVYTFDEKSQELVLQAGYGEPGRVMKEQGHKIALDAEQSLVARAARARELVVVDDVTKESGFMSNPLLPDTRSEVAVPLMVGDRLLGVFDVQDAHVGRFVAGDLSVLQTLAGQVSTALQNALYFDEIQKTTARLREVDRLKSEFLANMSHELRTPLNSIIGYSEVLMMGIDGDLEPETLEDIKAIYDNGQHLLAMINDILDLAKIEAGRMTLKTEELDLVLMVEEVKSATMGLFHKKPEVEFQVVIDGELPVIRGDRIRLSQVFINLVSNAEKFTEKGSVKVRAYRQGRHWNCITVEDTGIGIPEDEISGLFEKFHQVDGSSKRRAQGTGLGLAISKELVQLHGGRIEVRSKYGEGSSFTVWLPVAE
jgi:PAS domain S-box-containing protein